MPSAPQASPSSCTPRVLASAIGVALTTVGAEALAADARTEDNVIALDATRVTDVPESAYKAESASTKYTAPLRETPRSITVISEEVIKDSGSLSLADALRNTSGITFGAGEGGNPAADRPIIRGFNAESDIFVDGLRDIGAQTREVFNLQQVEVSKGPGSAYTGAGSTGGSLNLISKSAQLQDFADAGFTYGSDHTRRYTLDVNRVLGDNLAGRLNLMQHDADVAGRDSVDVSRWGVAPTLTFGFDTPTRATLSYYHLETDELPDYGIPLSPPGERVRRPVSVDRDNFYGLTERDFRNSTSDSGTFKIEHDLHDDLTLSNTTRLVRTTLDYIVTNPDDSRGNLVNGYVLRSAKSRNSTNEGWINQTDLRARFTTGFMAHTLVAGIEASQEGVHNHPYLVTQGAAGTVCGAAQLASGDCTSLHDPNPGDRWTGSIAPGPTRTDTDTETLAGYVFDTLKFNEQWSLNLGLRYDDYETRAKVVDSRAHTTTRLEKNTHFWNYQVGVVFNPLPNGSLYVAWSTSSNPSGETGGEGADSLSAATAVLDPERNRNYEVGTKWEFFDERLGLNAALFRTEKTNARVTDADGVAQNIGETRVDGFELGASGNLTERWQVFANYTYLDSEIIRAGASNIGTGTAPVYVEGLDDGNQVPNAPENSFSFWTTYRLLPRLTIGGGANYLDSRYGNTANSVQVPDYWRYDAMAQYEINTHLDLQLNVQNLTDKRYFDQVYSSHYAHLAPGRTALLSTSLHF